MTVKETINNHFQDILGYALLAIGIALMILDIQAAILFVVGVVFAAFGLHFLGIHVGFHST